MKRCTICDTEKPYSDFHKQAREKDGHCAWCKPCKKEKKREEYARNKDKYLERSEKFRKENPERAAEIKRQCRLNKIDQYKAKEKKSYAENKDRILQQARLYREKNKEEIKRRNAAYREARREERNEKQKKYYRENKESVLSYHKRYAEENAGKIKERTKGYRDRKRNELSAARKKKIQSDPIFKLSCTMRSSLCKVIARMGYTKKSASATILGCDWAYLKKHIESQFEDGMSWDNRGLWHIDHRIPLASAKTEAEVYKLCHFSNLQPLWALDNLKKGASMPKAA